MMETAEREKQLRQRLGIPTGAERVIVFGESSHWDPNWLLTSEQYYRFRVKKSLDRALAELDREPGRVYSLECMFFLKMYWDRNPERRDRVRQLVNSGRLRLTGGGVTTPDTILPATEAVIRDYLIGQQWLRANGMTQEPRLAYLPDDFGHSPALPAILAALGFDYAAVSRIDGMFFAGSDYESARNFPRPGSSAELLLRDLRTLDFVWRAPDGAEVLAHWNAFTYFQADMIAHAGPIKWMGLTLGVPQRSEAAVAQKISGYARRLEPLARTPYLFCPIGCDFVDPVRGLAGLLDRFNDHRFSDTGLYAIVAGMDDYLALVDCHRDRLPVLDLDPNPYWMGFYSARPEMKQRCARLARDLVQTEKLAALVREKTTLDFDPERELAPAWYTLAVSNHHDFITGTAPDRVWTKEQRPWLVDAQAQVDLVRDRVIAAAPKPRASKKAHPVEWGLQHGRLVIESAFYEIELDERAGGCITVWRDLITDRAVLRGPGADAVCYEDRGGLWRMGHEYRGGRFRERERSSRRPAAIAAHERDGLLEVEVRSLLDGKALTRRLWFRSDSPLVRVQVAGRVGRRRTVTCRFPTTLSPPGLVMDVPGGVVERPLMKIYNPCYWPAYSFAHVGDVGSEHGLAALFAVPAAVSANPGGVVEWVALRNAPQERAYGFVPLLAHPAFGTEPGEQSADAAVRFTAAGNWRANQLYVGAGRVFSPGWTEPSQPDLAALADFLVYSDNEEVIVGAVKRAEAGDGLVVRLFNFHGFDADLVLRVRGRKIRRATLCDARERELGDLDVTEDGAARVPLTAHILTVKIN